MKFLKNIFTFTIPLSIMLLSFIIYLFSSNISDNYEKKIAEDYSIVIITNTPLIKEKINVLANIKVKKIITLKKNTIINDIKSNLSKSSIELLRRNLPYFYTIQLEVFPTTQQLKIIKQTLFLNKNIRKIEIFSKNHSQIYLLLQLLYKISLILFTLLTIFAILIISKQIRIWFFEHQEKIEILKLHGASILYSSTSIFKYAIYSSLIAFILISGIYLYAVHNIIFILPSDLENIIQLTLTSNISLMKIFLLSFSISIFTVIGVLLKYKIKYD